MLFHFYYVDPAPLFILISQNFQMSLVLFRFLFSYNHVVFQAQHLSAPRSQAVLFDDLARQLFIPYSCN